MDSSAAAKRPKLLDDQNGDGKTGRRQNVTVVLGAQWGDEGKGKIVDMLAQDAQVVCRCQGGNNAGHTVVVGEKEYDFHLLPSGMINPDCKNVIGNGVVIHLPSLFKELEKNGITNEPKWNERLIISDRAHLVFDFHQEVDGLTEGELNKSNTGIGTTKKGIGPTYSSKSWRSGLRVCDLLGDFEEFETRFKSLVNFYKKQFPSLVVDFDAEFKQYRDLGQKLKELDLTRDTVSYLSKKLHEGNHVLVEGANGTMLDIDFGTYPFVTSSNCTIGGVLTGLGIAPQNIGDIVGIVKAYCTRVGAGFFPTEQKNDIGETLVKVGKEFGVTTGRKRRCGWLDMVMLKYSHMINGFTKIALTKLDILDDFDEIKIGVAYTLNGKPIDYVPASHSELEKVTVEYLTLPGWKSNTSSIRLFSDLPLNAQTYVQKIQELLQVPIAWIGVGKARASLVPVPSSLFKEL